MTSHLTYASERGTPVFGRILAPACGGIVVLIGLSALAGWVFRLPLLASWDASFGSLRPLAAVGLVSLGLSLFLVPAGAAARAACAGVLGVFLLVLVAHGLNWNSLAAEVAPATALGLSACALGLASERYGKGALFGLGAATIAVMVAVTSVLTGATGVDRLSDIPPFSSVALPTATGLLLLAAGLVEQIAPNLAPLPPQPLTRYLAALGLIVLVPLAFFGLFVTQQLAHSQYERVRIHLSETVRGLSQTVDRELIGEIETLRALAASPSIAAGDLASFHVQARSPLVERGGGAIALTDRSLQQVVNTRLEFGSDLPRAIAADFTKSIFDKASSGFSDFFIGPATGLPSVAVGVEVVVDGEVRYVLSRVLQLDALARVLKEFPLPANWTAGIADRDGRILANSAQPDMVGRRLPADQPCQSEGIGDFRSAAGTLALCASGYAPITGWHVAMWAPRAVLDANTQALWRTVLWLSIGALVTILVATAGLSKLLARAIGAPSRMARAWSGNVAPTPEVTILSEVNDINDALRDAIERRIAAELGRNDAERFAHGLVSAAPTLLYVYDLVQQRNVYIGPQIEALLGYLPAEVAAMGSSHLQSLIHHDDVDKTAAHISALSKGRVASGDIEYRLRHRDGSWRWLLSRDIVFKRGVSGRATQIIGAAQDITALKSAEADLKRQAHRQGVLLDVTTALIAAPDSAQAGEAVFSRISREFDAEVCFNYHSVPAGDRFELVFHKGIPEAVLDAARTLKLNEAFCGTTAASCRPTVADSQTIAQDPNGAFVASIGVTAYACLCLRASDGRVLGTFSLGSRTRTRFEDDEVAWLGTLANALAQTWERLETTDRLAQSEHRLSAILEALPVGVSLVDRTGETMFANTVYRGFVPRRIPSQDPTRSALWRSFEADGTAVPLARYPAARALAGERVWPGVEFQFDGFGSTLWTRVSAVPFVGTTGHQEGALVVIDDIDQEKRAWLELDDLRKRLAGRVDDLGRLHDLGLSLVDEGDANGVVKSTLAAALRLLGARHGSAQLVDASERLRLVAEAGFDAEFETTFAVVTKDGFTTCAKALRTGKRIVVPDLTRAPEFAQLRSVAASYGCSAVVSNPLLDPAGQVRAVFTIYFRNAYEPSERDLDVLDLCGELAQRHLERIASEAALVASETKFRAFFEHAPVGVARVGGDGRWFDVNDTLCRFLGYAREELVELSFQDITFPDDLAADLAQVDRILAGEIDSFAMEKRYRRKDGRIVWGSLSVGCVRRGDGTVEYLISSVEDIDRRKQDAENLANRTCQLDLLARTSQRLILSSTPEVLDAVFADIGALIGMESFYQFRVADDDPRLLRLERCGGASAAERETFASMRFGELLCCKVAETRGRLIVEDLPNSGQVDAQLLAAGGYRSFAGFPLLSGDELLGTVAFVSRKRTHFPEDELQTIQTVCDQIAATVQRARLHRELEASRNDIAASEERFRTFVTTAQEGIWAVDLDGATTFVNRRMAEMMGYEPSEMLGRPLAEFCTPEFGAEVKARIADNLAGEAQEFEFSFKRKDSTPLPVLAATTPLRNHDGTIKGSFGDFLDITERKKADERQSMLIRELAHRGKNLLSVIQSVAARSLTGGRSLDEAREVLQGRIQALANTYGILTGEVSEGVALDDIVKAELSAFSDRAQIGGPRILLTAQTAQTFALVVHELATNASKYGALSVPAGQLAIHWNVIERDGVKRFVLSWREQGGPLAEPPSRRGFGSKLITSIAGSQFGCEPRLVYDSDGFSYMLDAPLDRVGLRPDVSPFREKVASTTLQAFYDAWANARATGGVPAPPLHRFDRRPFAATGGLTIFEVGPQENLRIVEKGHALMEQLGCDLGDQDFVEDGPDEIQQAYLRCAKTRAPSYENRKLDVGTGTPVLFESLLVPFSRDGGRITHVAGLVVYSGAPDAPQS